jgi:hypothetical protein
MRSLIRLSLAATFYSLPSASVAAQGQTKPIVPANIDTTCSPCKDFFSR